MKKRYISYLVILSLFTMSLAACGRSNNAADQAVNPTPAPAQDAPAVTTEPEADTTPESTGSTSNRMKISLDPEDAPDLTEHEYTVNYTDSKTGKICIVDFSSDGHSYEMCVSGLAEEFTDDQINTLINAFLSGNVATIESDDLIDAEKFSEYIYGTLGDWVFSDDYRSVDDWAITLCVGRVLLPTCFGVQAGLSWRWRRIPTLLSKMLMSCFPISESITTTTAR